MLYSKILIPTTKEIPSRATIVSHKLMIKSGMIKRISSGIYCYLPLGLMVIKKFSSIIRNELNKINAQEILMPLIQPSILWKKSKRENKYGHLIFKIKDRNNFEFFLGPTNEEISSYITKAFIHSYKQLPLNFYQIQCKFRDEVRPRFGLMRCREFFMKDSYSFDISKNKSIQSYKTMFKAYNQIFKKCNLNYVPIRANSEEMGGDVNHEFHAFSQNGESEVITCSLCKLSFDPQLANIANIRNKKKINFINFLKLKLVYFSKLKNINLFSFLKKNKENTIKSSIYLIDNSIYIILHRFDSKISISKIRNTFLPKSIKIINLNNQKEIFKKTKKYINFLKKKMKIFGDNSITNLKNSFINLTKKNYQTIKNSKTNLNVKIHDLKKASFGDKCKYCFNNYNFHRSIEIGHIFNLETKYSKPMNLSIINKYGNSSLMRMGCYGIGISRTISAIIEQNNDENGILWPISISPFNVSIMPIKPIDKIKKICDKIYQNLKLLNIDVIYDNRSISYAKKLKDNDLIGIPIQIIIGKNYIKKNKIQIKIRKNNIKYTFDSKISIIINKIMELLNN